MSWNKRWDRKERILGFIVEHRKDMKIGLIGWSVGIITAFLIWMF